MDANNTNFDESKDVTVSIHAPVMDAKWLNLYTVYCSFVSIHAPVMDANIFY